MKKQKMGSIVNISSIYGVVGPDFSVYEKTDMTMPAAYSAIKGGVVNFTRYLASYYGSFGIRINCVSPGFIQSNMTDKIVESIKAVLTSRIPMSKLGTGEDVSNTVAFLSSDAASYITGQTLHVNGGMYMG